MCLRERKKSIMYELYIMHEEPFTLCQRVWEKNNRVWLTMNTKSCMKSNLLCMSEKKNQSCVNSKSCINSNLLIYTLSLCQHVWENRRKINCMHTHTHTHTHWCIHTCTHNCKHVCHPLPPHLPTHTHTKKQKLKTVPTYSSVEFVLTCSLGWSCFPRWWGGRGQSAPGPECGPPGRTGVGLDARLTCCTCPTGLAENQTKNSSDQIV